VAVQTLVHLLLMYLKYSVILIALVILLGAGLWLWTVAKAWFRRAHGPD